MREDKIENPTKFIVYIFHDSASRGAAIALKEWFLGQVPNCDSVDLKHLGKNTGDKDSTFFSSAPTQLFASLISNLEYVLNGRKVWVTPSEFPGFELKQNVSIYLGSTNNMTAPLPKDHLNIRAGRGDTGTKCGWEYVDVLNKSASVPIFAQLTSELPETGAFSVGGHYPSMGTFNENRSFINRVVVQHCQEVLSDYFRLTEFLPSKVKSPEVPSTNEITSGKLLVYLGNRAMGLLGKIKRVFGSSVSTAEEVKWNVALGDASWKQIDSMNVQRIENPNGRALADPFIVNWNGMKALFVEDIDSQGKGRISALSLEDGKLGSVTLCLEEEFHLSFPYTFSWDGMLYMCPESSRAKEIRLYRCIDFPFKWEYSHTLMKGVEAVDTVIFPSSGLWWMLTGISRLGSYGRMSELKCFYSDSPISTSWTPHLTGTVVRDSRKARNGGLVLQDGRIFRVGQSFGFQQYGAALSLNEIVELSATRFREIQVMTITPPLSSPIKGLHHLSSTEEMTAFDFQASVVTDSSKIELEEIRNWTTKFL